MSVSSDSAEQVVRFGLEGAEVVAKVTGQCAKEIIALIAAALKSEKQTKGKTNLAKMLKSGKELTVFSVKQEDLDKFAQEAKRYRVSYNALVNKKSKDIDGMVDIIVYKEDASRINRIVERFKLSTVDTAKIKTEIQKSREEKAEDKNQNNIQNPNLAKTDKNPLSEHFLKTLDKSEGVANNLGRKSVKKQLTEIREQMKQESDLSNKENKKLVKNKKENKKKINKKKGGKSR